MAYTIISQNNTTTTLSDENGNVITVPARVTLATSTDYTITKVNNNSVDLVDGNGKVIRGVPACVVLAGGGGDSHNKGYFATQAALEEAHPTAEAGDYAIVGSTDTVWVWDEDTSAWKDSDTKGQVTSVNGQTGDVTLIIPDAVQYSTMPTASADNLGDIVQFTGTTDANYTNGYFYKCVSDGQEPATYSWTRVDVQPAPTGFLETTGGTMTGAINMGSNNITFKDLSNNTITVGNGGQYKGIAVNGDIVLANGKVYSKGFGLTRESGNTTYPWAKTYTQKINNGADITVPTTGGTMAVQVSTLPTAASTNVGEIYQYIGATDSTYTNGHFYKCVSDGADPATYSWEEVSFGGGSSYTAGNGISIDANNEISVADPVLTNKANFPATAIQIDPTASSGMNGSNAIAIGIGSKVGIGGVVIGNGISTNSGYLSTTVGNNISNSPAYGSVNLGNGVASTAGSLSVALSNTNPDYTVSTDTYVLLNRDGTIPEARLADTTNAAQGQVLTLDSNLNAVWQAGGGGSSYTAGTGIDITNNTISVQNPVFKDTTFGGLAIGNNQSGVGVGSVSVGIGSDIYSSSSVSIGRNSNGGDSGVAIGDGTTSSYGGISIGKGASGSGGKFHIALTEMDPDTYLPVTHQYDLVNIDGTIPTDRLTKVNTTATLAVADWSSSTQTVTVSGVKADSVVFVSPAPASASDYATAGILCTAQAADSLTFTCTTTPTNAITVNVICM